MSRKVMDCCNRWRSRPVSFRMSPEEDALLDSMVRLSGMTKQDYITSRLECRDINVSPNVRVYRMLRDQMKSVYVELRRLRSADGIDERLIELMQVLTRVFVDLGVHQDGLVHISRMSNRFIRHPSEVVKVGDVITVWVVDVDLKKQRIGLSMLPPAQK